MVMVSGVQDEDITARVLDLGAYGYLTKPFSRTELSIAVANGLRRRELELESRERTHLLEEQLSNRTIQLLSTVDDLRAREAELRLKEETYRNLVANLPGVVYTRGANGELQFLDSKIESLTGYTAEELSSGGMRWRQAMVEEDVDMVKRVFGQAILGRQGFIVEYRIRRRDGEVVWVQDRGAPVFSDEGRFHHVDGVLFDVTSTKTMERQLLAAKDEWERTFDAVPDLIALIGADFRIKRINRSMAERLGRTADECVGGRCYEVVKGVEDICLDCPQLREDTAGLSSTREIHDERLGGDFLATETPYFDSEGGWLGRILMYRDITRLKEAERDRYETHRDLCLLLESISSMLICLDGEGRITRWNQAAEKAVGLVESEAVGRRIDDALLGAGWEQLRLCLSDVRKQGTPVQLHDFAVFSHQGEAEYYDVILNPVFSSEGGPSELLILANNTTERKRAEDQNKENLHFLQALMDAIPNPIYYKNKDLIFQGCNKAFESMIGKERNDIIGRIFADFSSEETGLLFRDWDRKLLHEEGVQIFETQMRMRDGKEHEILLNKALYRDRRGRAAGIVGVMQDISERKSAERSLREAHAEIQELLAAIPSILIGLTSENLVFRWNRAAEEAFGIEEKEVLGKSFSECPIALDLDVMEKNLLRCGRDGGPVRNEQVNFTNPQGKQGVLSIVVTPVEMGGGLSKGILVMGNDITDQIRLERQLAQAQKLESIGQLAAGIAHEINTPTQFVTHNMSFLQEAFSGLILLLDKYQELRDNLDDREAMRTALDQVDDVARDIDLEFLMEEVPSSLEETLDGLKRVSSIVLAMKNFSHPGTDEKTFSDINASISNTITVSRNEWKYVADMETDPDVTIPLVPCYVGELNQVILNLIVNASQAIGEMSNKYKGYKGLIRIKTENLGGECEISVTDNGGGIPEGIKDRIFDPFFTTKEVGKGTGQGLSLAHAVIVERHHGKIWCETESGVGTTFRIRLPYESDRNGLERLDA